MLKQWKGKKLWVPGIVTGKAAAVGGWTPASLGAALAGWYKADVGVYNDAGTTLATNGQFVLQWNDQSGKGNHLSGDGATNSPTYSTTGFNGQKTIAFDPVQAQGFFRTSFTMGTGNTSSGFVVGVITTGSVTPVANILCSQTDAVRYLIVNPVTTSIKGFDGSSIIGGVTITNGTNIRLGGIWDGTNYTTYLNNVGGTPSASTISLADGLRLNVGCTPVGIGPMGGVLSEVVVTNSALSSTDRTNLDDYFKAKWGL